MLTNTHMLHSFTFLAFLFSANVHVKVFSYLFSYKLVSTESLHFSKNLLITSRCPTVWESALEDSDISRLRKLVIATQFWIQIHKQVYFAAECTIEFSANNTFKKKKSILFKFEFLCF